MEPLPELLWKFCKVNSVAIAVCRSLLQHIVDCVRCVCIVGECDTVCGIRVVLRVLNSRDISCGKSGSVLTSGHGYTLQTLCIGSDVILCAAYLLSCVR